MKKTEQKLKNIKLMIHSNGIDFSSKMSSCKCQNCNIVRMKINSLNENEIKKMFKEVKN